MPAYVIGQISIKHPEKWAQYRSQVPATLEPYGAELVFRGTDARVFSGEHRHTDVVVIRFPDLASANAWHESASYQALVPLRLEAADVDLIRYEAET
jgi:uncharacterized protein (DUF1330 family)